MRRSLAIVLALLLSAAFAAAATSPSCTQIPGLACLAGRSSGQVLEGGTAASDTLTLRSTDAASPTGSIKIQDTLATVSVAQPVVTFNHDLTIDNASSALSIIQAAGTWTQTVNIVSGQKNETFLDFVPTLTNSGSGAGFHSLVFGNFAPTITATVANSTILSQAFIFAPTLGVSGAGTWFTGATFMEGFRVAPVINAGSPDIWGMLVKPRTGSGTPRNYVALEVEDISAGVGTNAASLKSSGATVKLQHVGPGVFGSTTNTASATLEVAGTTGAFLLPRLTTTQRLALAATNGMVLYNSTTTAMEARINGAWRQVGPTDSATFLLIPTSVVLATQTAALPVANAMHCVSFIPSYSIVDATKLGARITTFGTAAACAICVYNAAGTTLIASGSQACTAVGDWSATLLTAFSLSAGTKYNLCWSSNVTTPLWRGGYGSAPEMLNIFVTTNSGRATNNTTGAGPVVCPSIIGGYSSSTDFLPPAVIVSVE